MILAAIVAPLILWDHCDLVELNHYYDQEGQHVFTQLIFWDWCYPDCAFRVRAWRMAKKRPVIDRRRPPGVLVIFTEDHRIRKICAQSFRETWTQYDPEVHDRNALPMHRRVGLTKH